MMQEMAHVTQAPEPEVPLRAARVLRPLVGSMVEKQLYEAWTNPPPPPEVPELVMGRGYVPPTSARRRGGLGEPAGQGGAVSKREFSEEEEMMNREPRTENRLTNGVLRDFSL